MKPGDKIPFTQLAIGDIYENIYGDRYVKIGENMYRNLHGSMRWKKLFKSGTVVFVGIDFQTIIRERCGANT
jgi:hypothetical protein